MEVLIKTAAAAIVASLVCLLLKRSNPEMCVPLSVAVCVGAMLLSAGLLRPLLELLVRAGEMGGVSAAIFYPVMKSVGIGICTRVAADICKDSGQGAMAGCVELVGAICALYTALPLMEGRLDMLEELI